MKKLFLLIPLFIYSFSFSQTKIKSENPLQPMLSIGSGYYNSLGNIKGPKGNYLLGNMGINTGIRMSLTKDVDMSFLFTSNAKLYEVESDDIFFDSKINSLGFNFDYNFNNFLSKTKLHPFVTGGAQWMYFKTTTQNITKAELETGLNFPLGAGISLDISERIRFDVGFNYHISLADIDHSEIDQENDNFSVIHFTMHYDLFTPKPKEINHYDDSHLRNINFDKLDEQDSDGDGISDINDECPDTQLGITVDEKGCPYDTDNDGVYDYIDKEENTKAGSIVNQEGITLTKEQLKDLYSDYEAASKEYANYYNESQINKDDWKSVNERLLHNARKFNKNSTVQETQNITKLYKIQLMNPDDKNGRFTDDVPNYLLGKLLSYKNLESLPQNDYYVDNSGYRYTEDEAIRRYGKDNWEDKTIRKFENVVYCISDGKNSFTTYEQAELFLDRMIDGEIKEWNDLQTKIVVVENGVVSDYIKPVPKEEIIIEKEEIIVEQEEIIEEIIKKSSDSIEHIMYRVQLIAMERDFPRKEQDIIFKTLEPKPIQRAQHNGLAKYYIGEYTNYQDALIKRDEMRKLRGFETAFIVTFKNGVRVDLGTALKTESRNKKIKIREEKRKNKESEVIKDPVKINFFVQVLVKKGIPNEETKDRLNNMDALKISMNGDLNRYISKNIYNTLESAMLEQARLRNNGFEDAFIYAEKDGKRITIKEANQILEGLNTNY